VNQIKQVMELCSELEKFIAAAFEGRVTPDEVHDYVLLCIKGMQLKDRRTLNLVERIRLVETDRPNKLAKALRVLRHHMMGKLETPQPTSLDIDKLRAETGIVCAEA